jgi:integrase
VITSLERDVFPATGGEPLASLKPPRVLEVLSAIENRDAIETAKRIRQRISAVFVYAIAAGLAESDPAALVRGALKPIVLRGRQPAITNLTGVRQVLIDAEAERCRAVTKFALRFLALTAVRPGELRGARWDEMEGLDDAAPVAYPSSPNEGRARAQGREGRRSSGAAVDLRCGRAEGHHARDRLSTHDLFRTTRTSTSR